MSHKLIQGGITTRNVNVEIKGENLIDELELKAKFIHNDNLSDRATFETNELAKINMTHISVDIP